MCALLRTMNSRHVGGNWTRSMSFSILGLGTALPAHTISQQQAMGLAVELCSTGEEQARALRVLYRRSGVENRYTVLPHWLAVEWKGGPDKAGHGPTTHERMQLYDQH